MTDHSAKDLDPSRALHHEDDLDVPLHPLADRFDAGGWDRPGQCICGAPLPPQRDWHDAGRDWQHVRCPACGTFYVDEEEFFAIYDPTEPSDPADESCARCRHELAITTAANKTGVVMAPPSPTTRRPGTHQVRPWEALVVDALDEIEKLPGFEPDQIAWDNFRLYTTRPGPGMEWVSIYAYPSPPSGPKFVRFAATSSRVTMTDPGRRELTASGVAQVLDVPTQSAETAVTELLTALQASLAEYNATDACSHATVDEPQVDPAEGGDRDQSTAAGRRELGRG